VETIYSFSSGIYRTFILSRSSQRGWFRDQTPGRSIGVAGVQQCAELAVAVSMTLDKELRFALRQVWNPIICRTTAYQQILPFCHVRALHNIIFCPPGKYNRSFATSIIHLKQVSQLASTRHQDYKFSLASFPVSAGRTYASLRGKPAPTSVTVPANLSYSAVRPDRSVDSPIRTSRWDIS